MKLLAHPPEVPITEEWAWQSDVMVSTDGTEQRVALSEFPKRTLQYTIGLDTEAEVNAALASLMLAGAGLDVPFYAAATRLTGAAAIGAEALSFVAGRTDLRDGCDALLFDRAGRVERVTIDAVVEAGASLTAPLALAWGAAASIAPIWPCFSTGSLSVARNNPDYVATIKIALTELDFMEPFANEFAEHEFTMFNGYPVLEQNATGTEFEQSYDTGAQTIDFGQRVEIRNPWAHAQIVMPRIFLCQRVLQPATWAMWRAFADYAKGSTNPFYIPTFRNDFETVSIGEDAIEFKGSEYADSYASFEPFRQLAFFLEDGGLHFASVSDCAVVGGNSAVEFEPALPNDAVVTKTSLLLKVRIADGKISCQHEALETMLAINLRTAD